MGILIQILIKASISPKFEKIKLVGSFNLNDCAAPEYQFTKREQHMHL
jgi:hypothetical protein